jgi:GNAT superfamily N-acetyltransferase
MMDDEYRIVLVEKPDDVVWTAIGGGLQSFNVRIAGEEGFQRLCFVIYAPDQSIAGGVIGEVFWSWLYVSLMFVKEELRGRGYGHRLLTLIEAEACKHGARNVFLDTFSFQAPDFYEKHGYRVFGELPDFPPGFTRYYLTKPLIATD